MPGRKAEQYGCMGRDLGLRHWMLLKDSDDGGVCAYCNRTRRDIEDWDKERESKVKQEKGVFGGICGTPGCDRPARWIPIPEGNQGSRVYRCTVCCDAVRAADHVQNVYVATFTPAEGGLGGVGALEWTTDRHSLLHLVMEQDWFASQRPGDVVKLHVIYVGPGSEAPPWTDREEMTGYLCNEIEY